MTANRRFDDALDAALDWTSRHREQLGGEVYLVRDIYGRIRVVPSPDAAVPSVLADELHAALGGFAPPLSSLFLETDFVATEGLTADRTQLAEGVWLVDRLVSEQGWRHLPVASPNHQPRIVFFGIKGGVGRSTALVAAAKRFTEKGLRVLVLDLDLESPGATSMLLRPEELPPFGIVDWFVEEAVGQADDDLLRGMVVQSRVGEVLVAPAVGARSVPETDEEALAENPRLSLRDGAFIAKLGRAYASPDGTEFALRLERLIEGLERVHEPDVLLIDSRAGMHDIAAAAVPRLGATVLLFAGATSQTWLGYRLLFSAWRREREVVARFRARLKVVASQVPETGREAYVERLREAAYDLFAGFIYEGADGTDSFSYDVKDRSAPHAPLPIYWRRELVEWEPAAPSGFDTETLTPEQFEAAFGPFLRGLLDLPYVSELVSDEEAS